MHNLISFITKVFKPSYDTNYQESYYKNINVRACKPICYMIARKGNHVLQPTGSGLCGMD